MKSGAINLRGDSAGEQDEGLDAAVAGPAYKCQVREGGPTIHSASTGYINVTVKISLKNGSHMRRVLLIAFVCFIYIYIFFLVTWVTQMTYYNYYFFLQLRRDNYSVNPYQILLVESVV